MTTTIDGSLKELSFKQDLTKVRARDLLSALEQLYKELSTTEQDKIDLETVKNVSSQLISKSLLTHKEPGVRAYTASCLTDILRLFAPDAPYTLRELNVSVEVYTL
jgi:sister-chromatid-cohesion protein PDS5